MSGNVLLVDDDPDIREIGALCLKVLGGFNVLLAESGVQALAIVRSEPVDAILLDVMMPDMDGVATFAALKADPRGAGIPVIFLTARSSHRDVHDLVALEPAGVITKPFDPAHLAEEMRRIVGASPRASG